jgi:hypothetical protein
MDHLTIPALEKEIYELTVLLEHFETDDIGLDTEYALSLVRRLEQARAILRTMKEIPKKLPCPSTIPPLFGDTSRSPFCKTITETPNKPSCPNNIPFLFSDTSPSPFRKTTTTYFEVSPVFFYPPPQVPPYILSTQCSSV